VLAPRVFLVVAAVTRRGSRMLEEDCPACYPALKSVFEPCPGCGCEVWDFDPEEMDKNARTRWAKDGATV